MESASGRTYDGMSRTGDDWTMVASARVDGPLLTRHITTVRYVQRRLRVAQEVHRVRLYSRGTIAAALGRAGFAVTMRRSIGRVRVIRGDVVACAHLP
jgi:hypothetical protein